MEPAWEKYYSRLRGHIQEAIDDVIVDNIIPHIRLTNNVDVSLDGLLKSETYDKAIFNLVNTCISELKDAYYESSGNTITSSTVYSDSFDEMVQKDFTYKGNKYTWNDSDCVYYNDNGDEDDFFMEIPEGAITSAKKSIKSGYYDTTEHSEGGGTCDNCNGEVMPGDGYESDFESSREIAADAIYERLSGKKYRPVSSMYEFANWLGMDEDELDEEITDILRKAFNGKDYLCPDCAKQLIKDAAFAWAEDNYEVD